MSKTEQTLSIIKPDAVERNLQDEIKNEFKNKGFEIINYLLKINSQTTRFYNVNFPYIISPNLENVKSSFTTLASQKIADEIIFDDNFSSFKIGRMINNQKSSINTDLDCLKKNKISITPLTLNLSNNEFFNKMNHDI